MAVFSFLFRFVSFRLFTWFAVVGVIVSSLLFLQNYPVVIVGVVVIFVGIFVPCLFVVFFVSLIIIHHMS